MNTIKKSFYSLSHQELTDLFQVHNLPPTGVDNLFRWHYKKKETTPCLKDLAKKSIAFIEEHFHFQLPTIVKSELSDDGTVKMLLQLSDGELIEMVIIKFHTKYTLCLSSQVGCAMNCSFCFTGKQGLKRHLQTHEIVAQFILASRWLKAHRPEEEFTHPLKNTVFMGQGEPLHNFDEVKKAVDIFLNPKGLSLGIQKITISTAGYLPGLKRWLQEMPKVNLALSLHSVDINTRNELIPINRAYPLEEVIKVIQDIPLQRKQYVLYEYLLIKNKNDSLDEAHALGKLLQGTASIINLIPFNPFPGTTYEKPAVITIENFRDVLVSYNLAALIRGTKGDDILAACGQLNSKHQNSEPLPSGKIEESVD